MTDDLIQADFMLHTFDGKQYLAKEDAEFMAALIETGSRIDGELRGEIERLRKENQELKLQYLSDQGQWIEETGRLRKALRDIRDYDGKNPVIYDADDAIEMKTIASTTLGEKE